VTSQYAAPPVGPVRPAPGRDPGADARTLAELRQLGGRPVLIKGAVVLSQDPAVGDYAVGDILIRDGKIVHVGENLAGQAGRAVVIDAAGTIAVPGFVDAHVHAWEGQLRGAAPVLDFGGYLGFTAFGYGPHYRPHDNYIGTLATALVALAAGTTTMVDNSHNSRSPEHSSAAVEALIDAGIRGVHASGAPVGADLPTWPADVTRLRSEYFSSEDQLVTLRLFDLYPSADLWEFARREGLWVSSEMGSHIDNVADVLADLNAKGLLSSEHAFNHCNALPDQAWELIKSSGAAVNLAPRSDAAFGLGSGFPPIDQARAAGIVPGLSGDNEISYGLSMFTEMQTLLNKHRGSVFGRIMAGEQNPPEQLAPADVLRFATVGGAANAGLAHKIGSLTPGKEADIALIRTTDVNTAPGSNAVATVTAFAHAGNVDTVLVAGQIRKWRGQLTGHDMNAVTAQVLASRDYLFAGSHQRAGVLADVATSPL
jgi:5-methylthioadenosine/S-adenosylhomocysteine deaminase